MYRALWEEECIAAFLRLHLITLLLLKKLLVQKLIKVPFKVILRANLHILASSARV